MEADCKKLFPQWKDADKATAAILFEKYDQHYKYSSLTKQEATKLVGFLLHMPVGHVGFEPDSPEIDEIVNAFMTDGNIDLGSLQDECSKGPGSVASGLMNSWHPGRHTANVFVIAPPVNGMDVPPDVDG